MDQLFQNKLLFAHRGASALAPENTLAAMQLAQKLGAKWVEFDVTLSKDGDVFVFHDKTLDRTTDQHGLIAKKTAKVLKKADAGSWFSPEYKGATIPTLAELLPALGELGLSVNIELKPHDNRITELVVKVLDTVREHWPAQAAPPLFSSFSHQAMVELRQRDPQAKIGLLLHEWRMEWQAEADALQCTSIHVDREILTPRRIAAIKHTGRAVYCYTINTRSSAQRLFAQGVDGIFSNYPDLLTSESAPQ